MQTVPTPAPGDETRFRRTQIGKYISVQIEMLGLDRVELAATLGVGVEEIGAWERGEAAMTLDDALELDREFGLPAGTTGAQGGYFSCWATPALEGEEVFDTRVYADDSEMLDDLESAVKLGIGVRLSNRWEPIEVDEAEQSAVSTKCWVLDLLTDAPAVDPFE